MEKNKTLNEEINRMKSLMSEELLYGNLVDKGINADILKEEWVVINNLINEELLIEQPWRQIFKNLTRSFKSAPFKTIKQLDGFNSVLKMNWAPKNMRDLNSFFQSYPVPVLQSLKKQTSGRQNIWKQIESVNSKDWMLFLEGIDDMTLNPIKYLSKDGKSLVIPDEFHRLFYNIPESLVKSISQNVIKNGADVKMKEFYKKIKNLPGKTYEKMRNKIKSFFGKGKKIKGGTTKKSPPIRASKLDPKKLENIIQGLLEGTFKEMSVSMRSIINGDKRALVMIHYALTPKQLKDLLENNLGSFALMDGKLVTNNKLPANIFDYFLAATESAGGEIVKTVWWKRFATGLGSKIKSGLNPKKIPRRVRWVFPFSSMVGRNIWNAFLVLPELVGWVEFSKKLQIPSSVAPSLFPFLRKEGLFHKNMPEAGARVFERLGRLGAEFAIVSYIVVSIDEGEWKPYDKDESGDIGLGPTLRKYSHTWTKIGEWVGVLWEKAKNLFWNDNTAMEAAIGVCNAKHGEGTPERKKCIEDAKSIGAGVVQFYDDMGEFVEKTKEGIDQFDKSDNITPCKTGNQPDFEGMKRKITFFRSTTIKKAEEHKMLKWIVSELLDIDGDVDVDDAADLLLTHDDVIINENYIDKMKKEWVKQCAAGKENEDQKYSVPPEETDTTNKDFAGYDLPPVTIDGENLAKINDPFVTFSMVSDLAIILPTEEEETA